MVDLPQVAASATAAAARRQAYDEEEAQQQQQHQSVQQQQQRRSSGTRSLETSPLLGPPAMDIHSHHQRGPKILSLHQELYLKQQQQQQQGGAYNTTYTSLASANSPSHYSYTSSSHEENISPRAPPAPPRMPVVVSTRRNDDDDDASSQDSYDKKQQQQQSPQNSGSKEVLKRFLLYLIYALVNVIIAIPALYGYAAVMFNHPVFAPHMNALSKLVVFSSGIHQLGFTLFSSLDFSIGMVQDAGLIFLSSMSHTIANRILQDRNVAVVNDDNGIDAETSKMILSTTCVFLALGTSLLGLVLIVMGKCKLANIVSYLPMPVVGGYLAFIGYFCCQAGVALCISRPLVSFGDWKLVVENWHSLLLATPGLLAGLLLTYISRRANNDAMLPLAMVLIPATFYVIIFATGLGLDGARAGGWVGQVAPPVPVQDLFGLVDLHLVQWHVVGEVVWTWVGMVFVVSFASCLDVAAISMDMGQALDTNRELTTVGICNFMSGLGFGFTGSYIFSQTIFTYRTGVHSRMIGILIMIAFFYVVLSPVNLLQLSPLFFYGSTLIFIGYDLLYEWFVEIRERVLLSEYAAIWFTFIAIQVAGVDAGILVGVFFTIIDHVVSTVNQTTVHRIVKRSRAVWTQDENKLLRTHAYHVTAPEIVTLELAGPVFFGSSLNLLSQMADEVGIRLETFDTHTPSPGLSPIPSTPPMHRSPHTSFLMMERRPSFIHTPRKRHRARKTPPKFCVLDLSAVSAFDASAARACFLQFVKMCTKKGTVVCAVGATPRIDWMLRAHGIAFESAEEEKIKARFESLSAVELISRRAVELTADHILLFLTIHEALEFCEGRVIRRLSGNTAEPSFSSLDMASSEAQCLGTVFARILDSPPAEEETLRGFDTKKYHREIEFMAGQKIFSQYSNSDALYVVLKGAVASHVGRTQTIYRHRQQIVSGAGLVKAHSASQSRLLDPELHETGQAPVVATLWPVGGIIGYSDLLLDRPYSFGAFATQSGTLVARVTRADLTLLKREEPKLDALLNRVLLRTSLLDLSNCTCDDV